MILKYLGKELSRYDDVDTEVRQQTTKAIKLKGFYKQVRGRFQKNNWENATRKRLYRRYKVNMQIGECHIMGFEQQFEVQGGHEKGGVTILPLIKIKEGCEE